MALCTIWKSLCPFDVDELAAFQRPIINSQAHPEAYLPHIQASTLSKAKSMHG